MAEILRPGRTEWEDGVALGSVPLADVVGSLIRYPSGIVTRVTGLTEPDERGTRQLLMEVNEPTEGA
jgi:hypothetical protein